MPVANKRYGLAEKGDGFGLSCDPGGLSLAGAPLLRRTAVGFEPRPAHELEALMKAAYGRVVDQARLASGLCAVAKALDGGELGRAMMIALHLRLPDLDIHGAARLADIDDALAKANFNSAEPRDPDGEWTFAGEGGSAGAYNRTRGARLVPPTGHFRLGGRHAMALFQPQMADALSGAIKDLNARGIVPTINSGYRTPADQQRMRHGGSGRNQAAKVSWHQVGMAVDINGTSSPEFPEIVHAMRAHGFTWGGTFRRPDRTHFQLPPAGTSPSPQMVTAYLRGGDR